MPSLSLNIGLNNGRKLPFGGGAAPSGIPVASTASVVISGNATFNGTAVKKVNPEICFGIILSGIKLFVYSGATYSYELAENYGKILIPPQTEISVTLGYPTLQLETPFATWRLVEAAYDSGEDVFNILNIVNNASTNPNYIPTTGWSPAITITAA